jgi:quercetin dioxygenase-like cupin family protein
LRRAEYGPDATGEAVAAALRGEGLVDPTRWSNEPGYRYSPHDHPYAKVLVCLRGSIVFDTVESGAWSLARGDRLEVDAGVVHGASVGDQGVECLEARRA